MKDVPAPVGLLLSAGLLLDSLAVLVDPRGSVPLCWGAGALLLAAAFLWPRDGHAHQDQVPPLRNDSPELPR